MFFYFALTSRDFNLEIKAQIILRYYQFICNDKILKLKIKKPCIYVLHLVPRCMCVMCKSRKA